MVLTVGVDDIERAGNGADDHAGHFEGEEGERDGIVVRRVQQSVDGSAPAVEAGAA